LAESIHFDVLVELLFLLWKVDELLLKCEVEVVCREEGYWAF
jgi:hypothetical protein